MFNRDLRLSIAFLLIFLNLSLSAQESIKGTWLTKAKMMGTQITSEMTFDDDTEGTVKDEITIKINMFGIEASAVMGIRGTFKLEGNLLTVRYDPDSLAYTAECSDKENGDAMLKAIDEIMKTNKAQFEADAREPSVSTVSFKNSKLILEEKDKKGKTSRETYIRK